jgi:hypothetical protein
LTPTKESGLLDPFPIITVPDHAAEQWETVGTKPKFWYDKSARLFKKCRPGTGEDWAEKIAAELAELVGLPHAEVELATWTGERGVVTRSFVPNGGALFLGNAMLGRDDESYPAHKPGERRYHRVSEHTIDAILETLSRNNVGPPMDWTAPERVSIAREVFVGYLMLDAWIGNQDRHHENWGVIETVDRGRSPQLSLNLAPTFDHASSLGRNESDETRKRRLETRDSGYSVESYAGRARSAIYDAPKSPRPLLTSEAFQSAATRYPCAGRAWLDLLAGVSSADVDSLFRRVDTDRISETAIEFALRMLEANRKRLIELRNTLS